MNAVAPARGALAGLLYKAAAALNMRSFRLVDGDIWSRLLGTDSTSGKMVTVNTALQLDTVWACVRLIAETIATLPLGIYSKDGNGSRQAQSDHPLYTLLHDQPNADMTAVEFWESIIACMLLWGNGFARKEMNGAAQVIALTLLNPDRVAVRRGPDGSPVYTHAPPGGPREELTEDQVFHLKGFSLNGLVGLSVIAMARNSIGAAIAAEEAAAKIFANGLRPSGFFTIPSVLKDPERERLKANLGEHVGSSNFGRYMLLEAGLAFTQLTIPPEDAQLLATREFNVDQMCRWFRVPPWMIGHMAKSTSWGTGLEQQMLGFLTFSLRPHLTRIEQAVRKSLLLPAERGTIYAEFNLEGLLRADSAGRAALYSVLAQNGLRTRNELRGLDNLPPVEGADDLTVQSNLVPLQKLGQQAAQPTPAGFGLHSFPKPPDPKPAEEPADAA